MLKKLGNLFGGNKKIFLSLTNEQKVDEAKQKIESSLSMFSKINKDISEANEVLENVIKEETQRVIEIERNRDKASDELQANKSLQEKVQQFIL